MMNVAERQQRHEGLVKGWFSEFGESDQRKIERELHHVGSLEAALHHLRLPIPDHVQDQVDVLRNQLRRYGVENFLFQLKLQSGQTEFESNAQIYNDKSDGGEFARVELAPFRESLGLRRSNGHWNGIERRSGRDRRDLPDRRRRDDDIFHNMRTGEDRRSGRDRRRSSWPIREGH